MSAHVHTERRSDAASLGRNAVLIAGVLVVGGLLLNIVSTLAHPSGEEDDHEVIFTKYAESDPWVAVHLGQFVGVSLALGGLLALYVAMRAGGSTPLVAHFAAAATIATAAVWAVLQGLDGVGLKQAVDAGGVPREPSARPSRRHAMVQWRAWSSRRPSAPCRAPPAAPKSG